MASEEELVTCDERLRKRKSRMCVYTLTVLSTLGGFLFGYDTGVVSGAILLIKKDFDISYVWHELIVSSTVAAALIFSLIGGVCADRLGRKPTILLSGLIFMTGSIVMGVARSKEILLLGRLIVGVAIGFESMSVPVYIAECSDPSQRGMLITLYQLLITLGLLIANVVGGLFAETAEGWRYMLGLAAFPALLQFCGFLLMPESPRWLVCCGRYDDAIKVLCVLRGSLTEADKEATAIKVNLDEKKEQLKAQAGAGGDGDGGGGRPFVVRVFSSRPIRRALFVGCALQAFQQLSGINTVMYYSATIIRMAGVRDESLAIWLSAVTAAVNCACTFIGIYFVERAGRRKLVLFSLIGIVTSLLLLGIGFELMRSESPAAAAPGEGCQARSSCYECIQDGKCGFCFLQDSNGSVVAGSCWPGSGEGLDCAASSPEAEWAIDWCPNQYAWLTVLAMALYLISFAPGMGPMPWTINAEIYPLWARGFCTSLSTSFSWAGNLIVSSTFLSLMEALSKPGVFYLYAAIGLVGFALFWCTLPETVGCSLEQLENIFDGEWFTIRGRTSGLDTTKARGQHNEWKLADGDEKIDIIKLEASATRVDL